MRMLGIELGLKLSPVLSRACADFCAVNMNSWTRFLYLSFIFSNIIFLLYLVPLRKQGKSERRSGRSSINKWGPMWRRMMVVCRRMVGACPPSFSPRFLMLQQREVLYQSLCQYTVDPCWKQSRGWRLVNPLVTCGLLCSCYWMSLCFVQRSVWFIWLIFITFFKNYFNTCTIFSKFQ